MGLVVFRFVDPLRRHSQRFPPGIGEGLSVTYYRENDESKLKNQIKSNISTTLPAHASTYHHRKSGGIAAQTSCRSW